MLAFLSNIALLAIPGMLLAIAAFSESFWTLFAVIVSVTTALTSVITKWTKVTGFIRQATAWVVGSLLILGTYFLGLLEIPEPTVLNIVIACICSGLAANGVYDVPAVRAFLEKITSQGKDR